MRREWKTARCPSREREREREFSVCVTEHVTLTNALLRFSNTIGLMGSTTDNQKHLAIKPNNTNK